MQKKRDRLQIIHDILEAIRDRGGRIKPTQLLYKSNLSHRMMEEYLQELISGDFVVEHKKSGRKSYSLTDKGFDYLNKYELISDFTNSFGLQ